MSDTDRVAYGYSRTKLLRHASILAASAALIALNTFLGPSRPGSIMHLGAELVALLCPLVPIAMVIKACRPRSDVIVLTATGITATDVAEGEISWDSITGIGIDEFLLTRFLVLAVDPAAEARLALRRGVRWFRVSSRLLGIRGLTVPTQSLVVGCDALLLECRQRRERARGAVPPPDVRHREP